MKYFIIGLCMFMTCQAMGQVDEAEKRVDILKLQDGSKFIGKILYENSEYVLFYNETIDSLELDKNKIASIQRHKLLNPTRPSGISFQPVHKDSGLFAAFRLGAVLADEVRPHLDLTVGYRFAKHLTAGVQFGYDYNMAGDEGIWLEYNFYNVGAYGRYTFTNMRFRPYVSAYAGYGFYHDKPWINNQEGGINFEPGIGIQIATSYDIKYTLSLNQYIQPARAEMSWPDFLNNTITQKVDITLNRTVLKFGVEF